MIRRDIVEFSPRLSMLTPGCFKSQDGRYLSLLEVSPSDLRFRSAEEQDAMAQCFASLLRSSPDKLRIKITTGNTNYSDFTSIRLRECETESEPCCRELQHSLNEYLFAELAKEKASRRFFLCSEYPYLPHSQADAIQYLEQWNNHAASVLKSSRNTVRPLTEGEPQLLSPSMEGVVCSPLCCRTETYSMCFGYIPSSGYNPRVQAGWLSQITSSEYVYEADIWLRRLPKDKVLSSLRAEINRSKASLMSVSDSTASYDSVAENVESDYYIKSGLASGQDLWSLSVTLCVRGSTDEEAVAAFAALRRTLLCSDITILDLKYEQLPAAAASSFGASLSPSLLRRSGRNLLTEDAGSLYPFDGCCLQDPDGIYIGNTPSDGPAILDIFDTSRFKNANMFISGVSGAGKTYALSLMAMRLRLKQIPCIIIAPEKEHEFLSLCNSLGGQFIRPGSGSDEHINILDIPCPTEGTTSLGEASLLIAKVRRVKSFFRLLIPDLTSDEGSILDAALLEAYFAKGITSDNTSLLSHPSMPILSDLSSLLPTDGRASRLLSVLKVFTSGSGSSFNGETNVELSNPFTIIGLESLDEELLPAGIFIAMEYAWSVIKRNRGERKCLFIDEWWRFAFNPAAAAFSLEIAKTIRGYGGSLILATQELSDIFGSENGKYGLGVLNSCSVKLIMQLEHREAERVKELLALTDSAATELTSLGRGQALLNAGGSTVALSFDASPQEHSIITQ